MVQKKHTIVKTLRLKSELVRNIESIAESKNRNFNNMVETILLNAISKK